MSTQIAVRLSDDLVAFVDSRVGAGLEPSRAAVVTRALERERRRATAARDAEILAASGPDPDLAGLAHYAAGQCRGQRVRPIHTAAPRPRPAGRGPDPGTRARPHLTSVTVAPITRTVRGLSTEVPVGRPNGLDETSAVSCDNITTIPAAALGPQIGVLLDDQESSLSEAIRSAFDLD